MNVHIKTRIDSNRIYKSANKRKLLNIRPTFQSVPIDAYVPAIALGLNYLPGYRFDLIIRANENE